MNHYLGLCSWSLQADNVETLLSLTAQVGVDGLQLGLDPLIAGAWSVDALRAAFDASPITIRSGMIGMKGEDYSTPASIRQSGGVRPSQHWDANLAAVQRGAALAHTLGLKLVSFHAGYLPHEARDPERALLTNRLRRIVDVFAARGVRVALETGQESAQTLLEIIDEIDSPTLGVNFDPANMILYSTGDPVEALQRLSPHIFQIHIKDAKGSGDEDVWGEEVRVGSGEVRWKEFFEVLRRAECNVDLMIEREAGSQRVADMRAARQLLLELGVLEENR